MERVVVTGMGLVSPLGCGVDLSWQQLLKGESGVKSLDPEVRQDLKVHAAGIVPSIIEDAERGFDSNKVADVKDLRKMDRFIQFGLMAAEEALKQAAWITENESEKDRTATIVASGVGGFHSIASSVLDTYKKGARKLSPFTIPSFLANLAAGHISIKYGFSGPIGTPVTACAAGVQAIGDGMRLIQSGEVDVAICGGAEACIHPVSLGGFAAAKALSTSFQGMHQKASRPFDIDREGFVMGEGAGIVVLESLNHALKRGAKPLAELLGYGTTADAYHLTAGAPNGKGARKAMEKALLQGNIGPQLIDHINAHATSTQLGDKSEIKAIQTLFKAKMDIGVSATKSATGHLLGAAGGIETIFTVKALTDQVVPPTLNFDTPDPEMDGTMAIEKKACSRKIVYALNNGFGFGGVNASLLLKEY